MSVNSSERILTMTIGGKAAEGGHIPLTMLAEKLSSLQESLYSAANALEGYKGSCRGRWSAQILSSCKLTLRHFKLGSFKIEAEIPTPDQPNLTPELDPGMQALEVFRRAGEAVEKGDALTIQGLMPYSGTRERFLGKFRDLCPKEGEEYCVSLGNGKGKTYSILTVNSRELINNFVFADEPEKNLRKVKIRGELIEIRIKDEKRHIALETSQGEIICKYSSDMELYISSIPAGSVIEVNCMAEIDGEGFIKEVESVYDVDIINLPPLRLNKFTFENKRYRLKKEVIGKIEYKNDLWIYRVPRYGLHSYSRDRKEAFMQLNEEFAFLYDGLLNEPDENLTLDAIELRELLKKDIKGIEEFD